MIKSIDALRNYLLNVGIGSDYTSKIYACFHEKTYAKDTFFVQEGAIGNKLGFVIQGIFCMSISQIDGSFFVKDFITSNQFLLAALSPETLSNVSIQAIANAVVLEADYSKVQSILYENLELALLSKSKLEREFEAICSRMEGFAALSASQRYRLFLEKYSGIEEEIPGYLIASYLGITPTHLCRLKNNVD